MNPASPRFDRLFFLFSLQHENAAFYRQMRPEGFYALPPRERAVTFAHALAKEAGEVEDALGWKPWKNPPNTPREQIVEEVVDCWHFLIQLCLDLEISSTEVVEAYFAKTTENRRRQREDPAYRPSDDLPHAAHEDTDEPPDLPDPPPGA